ncbi:LAMI_0G16842g1_1 [Lachancea mirantina]|uniref:LAMI_0G16842g1_1 n=1 Tax=Lachancea mirantina TaxID=1230905 RepID=A0A1G4KCS7_9SACH|nr:LAMI_0G16842g1_1 [Lachancea mirantina]
MSSNAIPFPDIDPYEVLGIAKNETEQGIRKSYRKLMLRHHPDKSGSQSREAKELFHKIQFSYEILTNFKDTYDKTGSIEACFGSSDLAGWRDLFDMDVTINKDTIAEDKKKYRGSEDETEDIIDSWNANAYEKRPKRYVPDEDQFTLLFEEIPHLEATEEDEKHILERVGQLIGQGLIEDAAGSFEHWKLNRKKLLKRLQKRFEAERSQAEAVLRTMEKNKNLHSDAELRQLIQKKNKNSWDSLILKLEKKAGGARTHADLDDEEFEKIQKSLKKRRK